ncbi:MAG: hypothetical protein OXI51_13850 [Chloroflexota bacterium]|nr:hypothetical protein [Chloroflexota bacterium]
MADDDRADSEQAEFRKKNLKLITEVAVTTMSSSGLKLAFGEYTTKPTAGLFYTLSHCTFPLLEEVMKAIIEVAADGPMDVPEDLYLGASHDLRHLRQQMQAPTVFEAGVYQLFIADVNRSLLESRPSQLPLTRMQRDHPLLAGRSAFDNIIDHASTVWPARKYLEAGETLRVDPDLLPLAFDLSRWLLYEFLRYEKAHSRVAASFREMEQDMSKLLHVYD